MRYQISLICFAAFVIVGIGAFVYKELFPEYKVYQSRYLEMEKFRSSYTHEPIPPFSSGIKQIMLASEDGGPETIDRCISCHVATNLPHFSPTRLAKDVNGKLCLDAHGNPILEPNPDYVWDRLGEKIEELRHPAVIEQLQEQGKNKEARRRLAEAERLEALKFVTIEGRQIAVEKVIQMHPLIGAETRPFEFHPTETYGCTSCHSGNGRALEAERAHGPVFEGEYDPAPIGPKPRFFETDPLNDPSFARMYNHKPSHDLIFQTHPLLAGPLVEAKCVQCHQNGVSDIKSALHKFSFVTGLKTKQLQAIQTGVENKKHALSTLLNLQKIVGEIGRDDAIALLQTRLQNAMLTSDECEDLKGQITYLSEHEEIEFAIQEDISNIERNMPFAQHVLATGAQDVEYFESLKEPIIRAVQDTALIKSMQTNLDKLIGNYQRGKELFISQACYGCHRIAGFSRSSVGPELTKAGLNYPWYIKESIVWPQADLPSSTMPNFRLDHDELAALMTFLMAQTGETKAVSEVDYQINLSEWEKGKKMPWEESVPPTEIHDVKSGQMLFACEGCASCHKMEGFESAVKFTDREWFHAHIPEHITGSKLAEKVNLLADTIDSKIVRANEPDILDEIEQQHPGLLPAFYANFKFAGRSFDTALKDDPDKLFAYKERLHLVLLAYIQEYGLGREIAPPLHWSGVWRDDEWLLGHFRQPSAYTSKSLMPVMPFDDSKFYVLNTMLHEMGRKNRDQLRIIWKTNGFSPKLAYEMLCSSCHGQYGQGNGQVAQWIFPIPKNLRNPVFLQNLTKERAIRSITQGVAGTPMPPWGIAAGNEKPVLSQMEIHQLVDWLYQDVPVGKATSKWDYTPVNIIEEMFQENSFVEPENESCTVEGCFKSEGNAHFYLREKFYTPHNLQEGKQFYMANCAVCHGNEGAGTGLRATAMVEAKPRVFTDISWARSEDDLFLLRSIKYGVPGTAMVPWGDQTTARQRIQLTLYIRHLSNLAMQKRDLEEMLYVQFDQEMQRVEALRAESYKTNESLQQELDTLNTHLRQASSADVAAALYGKIFALQNKLKEAEDKDQIFLDLLASIKEEKKIYADAGEQIILAGLSDEIRELYFKIARTRPLVEKKILYEQLITAIQKSADAVQEKMDIEKGKMRCPEREHSLQLLLEEHNLYKGLKTKLTVRFADACKLREKQNTLYRKI